MIPFAFEARSIPYVGYKNKKRGGYLSFGLLTYEFRDAAWRL